MYGNAMALKSLLDCGADATIRCYVSRLSPLHLAAEKDDPDITNMLIASEADVDCVDTYGATPLHYATCKGVPGPTNALLQHKADIPISDEQGNTPLSLAVTLSSLNLSLSSSSTTSRELLSQFSTCSG